MNAEIHEDSVSFKYAADCRSLLPWLPQVVQWEVDELGATSHLDPATSPEVPEQVFTLAALHVSERLVRQFFDESPISVVVFDPDGSLVRVNGAFCAMLGYAADDLKERNIEELMHPDDVAASREHRRRMTLGTCNRYETETRFLPTNRPEIWTRVCARFERYAGEQRTHVFAHVIEIAEPKHVQEKRERMMAALLMRNWDPNCTI